MTYRELITKSAMKLKEAQVPDYNLDAGLLFSECFNKDKGWLLAHDTEEIPDDEIGLHNIEKYESWIDERAKRIPLQHILGHQMFMGLDFKVNEHVLIPRADTEILVEEILKHLHDGMCLLDMCTGSGCILTSLLMYSNNCQGMGVDISEEALAVARENSDMILKNRVNIEYSYVNSDLFKNIPYTYYNKFDIIVSNPPYIRSNVIQELEAEVKDHDPMLALDGGDDGLNFYRRIIEDGFVYLCTGGVMGFEIGYDQAEDVSSLFSEFGYTDIEVFKDYAGLDRVVLARKPIVVNK